MPATQVLPQVEPPHRMSSRPLTGRPAWALRDGVSSGSGEGGDPIPGGPPSTCTRGCSSWGSEENGATQAFVQTDTLGPWAPSLPQPAKGTQELAQKEEPEGAGGEKQKRGLYSLPFLPAVGVETVRNPCSRRALRGQGAEDERRRWWLRKDRGPTEGGRGSRWIRGHPCPDEISQAFPESRLGLGTIHPGYKSGSHSSGYREREKNQGAGASPGSHVLRAGGTEAGGGVLVEPQGPGGRSSASSML